MRFVNPFHAKPGSILATVEMSAGIIRAGPYYTSPEQHQQEKRCDVYKCAPVASFVLDRDIFWPENHGNCSSARLSNVIIIAYDAKPTVRLSRLIDVIPLPDFKRQILGPVLRGEIPQALDSMPITLFAARLDQPLRYVFESDRWDEIYGASRRLSRAGDKLRSVLAADGYTADDVLHASGDGITALCHDRALAERWSDAIERAVAAETDLVTVSTAVHTLTLQQVIGGLYRAPRTVLGVPGFNDYQERINRYYGLSSASTVPTDEAIAQRRHFGEVAALLHSLLTRAAASRQIVPFYEALPFAESCASCRTRPAETLNDGPVCGVCLRKRKEPQSTSQIGLNEPIALIRIEAVGFERKLEDQRSPSAYHRLSVEVNDLLRAASKARSGITSLALGGGWAVLVLQAGTALDAALAILGIVADNKQPFAVVIALGTAPGQFRVLHDLAEKSVSHMRRIDATALDIRVNQPGQPFDRFRKPFTVDEAQQLMAGAAILRQTPLPPDSFSQLAEQVAHGNAGLYYTFERSKLSSAHQQTLDRLERTWLPGPRFFVMLSVVLTLTSQQ